MDCIVPGVTEAVSPLLHGFLAKQACVVLWVSKPAFLSDYYLTGVSCIFLFTVTRWESLPHHLLRPFTLSLSFSCQGVYLQSANQSQPVIRETRGDALVASTRK